jgi:hypothetical protein
MGINAVLLLVQLYVALTPPPVNTTGAVLEPLATIWLDIAVTVGSGSTVMVTDLVGLQATPNGCGVMIEYT